MRMMVLFSMVFVLAVLTGIAFADGTVYDYGLSSTDCESRCLPYSVGLDHAHCVEDGLKYSCIRSTKSLACAEIQPSQFITMSNGCSVKVSPSAKEQVLGDATYSSTLYGSRLDISPNWKYIKTNGNFNFLGLACAPDTDFIIDIQNLQSKPSGLDVISTLLENRLSLVTGFGYTLETFENCKVQKLEGQCSTTVCAIPSPSLPAKTTTLMLDDNTPEGHFQSTFIVGECLENDRTEGTSTECRGIYGDSKALCDIYSNKCVASGICTAANPCGPVKCGSSGTATIIDTSNKGYWTLVTTEVKSSLIVRTNPSSGLNDKLIVDRAGGGLFNSDFKGAGAPESLSFNNFPAGTHKIRIETSGGSGSDYPSIDCSVGIPQLASPPDNSKVSTSVDLSWKSVDGAQGYSWRIVKSSDGSVFGTGCTSGASAPHPAFDLNSGYTWTAKACSDVLCQSCGSYAQERTLSTGECSSNNRVDGTSSQCLRNNQYLICDLLSSYACQTGPCNPNSNCADGYCCDASRELPPNLRGAGQCVPVSYTKQPYICIQS